MIQPKPEVAGLSGGKKQHYLIVHRDEILEYYHLNGEQATKEFYLIKDSTWDSFIKGERAKRAVKTSKVDLLLASHQVTQETVRQQSIHLRQLDEHFTQFTELVSKDITGAVTDYIKTHINELLSPFITRPEFQAKLTKPDAIPVPDRKMKSRIKQLTRVER